MAERNKAVNIYLAYSGHDKNEKNVLNCDIGNYLTKPGDDGEIYAKILDHHPSGDSKRRKNTGKKRWKPDAQKVIKKADVILLLCSDNTKDEKNAKNILWEINTAKEKGCNIIVCSLNRDEKAEVPEWLKKVDSKVKAYSWEELREKLELHVKKSIRFFRIQKDVPPLNRTIMILIPG